MLPFSINPASCETEMLLVESLEMIFYGFFSPSVCLAVAAGHTQSGGSGLHCQACTV